MQRCPWDAPATCAANTKNNGQNIMSSDNVQLVLHFAVLTIVFHSAMLVHTAKLKPPRGLQGRQNSESQVWDITTRSHWETRRRFRELKRPMLMTELMPEMLCWSSAWCCWSPLHLGIYQPKLPKPLLPSEQREKKQLQSHGRSPAPHANSAPFSTQRKHIIHQSGSK